MKKIILLKTKFAYLDISMEQLSHHRVQATQTPASMASTCTTRWPTRRRRTRYRDLGCIFMFDVHLIQANIIGGGGDIN